MAAIANPSTASLACIFSSVTRVPNAITKTCNLRRAEKLWGILYIVEECTVLKKKVRQQRGKEWALFACPALWGLWFTGADVAPTCQHKDGAEQGKQGSPWISAQPVALMTATKGMGREWSQGRSSMAWVSSGCVNESCADYQRPRNIDLL